MLDRHTISSPPGLDFAIPDRAIIGRLSVANDAGAAAGDAVTVDVTGQQLPQDYDVFADAGQDVRVYITAKTTTGFTVNILPGLPANTVAAGTVKLLIVA